MRAAVSQGSRGIRNNNNVVKKQDACDISSFPTGRKVYCAVPWLISYSMRKMISTVGVGTSLAVRKDTYSVPSQVLYPTTSYSSNQNTTITAGQRDEATERCERRWRLSRIDRQLLLTYSHPCPALPCPALSLLPYATQQ